MKRVLGIPAFRRLAFGAIVNDLAFLISETALALLIYHRTKSAFGATAFFLCAQFGPALVSPVVITRLDQRAVRRALALLYVAQGLIFVLLGEVATTVAVGWVLLLVLVQGGLAVSARVLSRSAWTAVTTAAGVLREGNAVANSAASVSWLVGPAIGGILVAAGGTRLPLFVNAALFVLCTLAVLTTRRLPPAATDRAPAASRIRAAFTYARSDAFVRTILGLQAAFMVFFTISIPVEVVFARHTLQAGAGGYGLLLSAWGGGAIAGSVVYARWRSLPPRILIALGAGLVGLGFLLMAVAPELSVAIAGAAVAGIGNGIEIVAMRTALQEAVPARSMSLILGFNESMFQAVPGIGIVAGGAITAVWGPRVALGTGAAGALVIALAIWAALPDLPTDTEISAPGAGLAKRELTAAVRPE